MPPLDDDVLRSYFGESFARVARFRELLAEEGVLRGLVGPREVDRLWERHILNSASVAAFLPAEGSVVDIGTGAGLPGVVLAAMRPDLDVTLLEPMLRRTTWLEEVVEILGLTNAEVVRGRAEELDGARTFDAATARAVAPLDRLGGWALPLLRTGGVLVALKGQQAPDELAAARDVLAAYGADEGEVHVAPTIPEVEPTTVVRIRRRRDVRPAGKGVRARRTSRTR